MTCVKIKDLRTFIHKEEDLNSFAIHLPQGSTSKEDQRVYEHCILTYGRIDTEECSTTHQSYVVTIAKIEGLFYKF